ncbi:MAG: extracellular solute-binding protein [Methyloceanibacter sp.]|jgi:putative spermidine/putrescine transport system substrate-binding protein
MPVLRHFTLRELSSGLPRLQSAAVLALVLMSFVPQQAWAQQSLSIATFGGAYGRAQEIAVLEPYARKTGTVISTESYGGKASSLRALIANDATPVDVVDVSAGALAKFCNEGLLVPIESDALESDGETSDDFLPGALSKCGVASMAWSMAVVTNGRAFRDGAPTTIDALLDVDRFPGKRALPNDAARTLELVLLADGVAPDAIYQALATPEGADRAFAALDKIRQSVLLWEKPAEPMAWVASGRASMAAGYSGRIFRAAVLDRNLEILWDGQIYDLDAWAVPMASKNKPEAMRFIRFATAPAQLAAQARLTAYGPMRKSALSQVGKHPAIGVDMQRFLPTAPANNQNALRFDQAWWDENGANLSSRFEAWAKSLNAPAATGAEEQQSSDTEDGQLPNATDP